MEYLFIIIFLALIIFLLSEPEKRRRTIIKKEILKMEIKIEILRKERDKLSIDSVERCKIQDRIENNVFILLVLKSML